MKKNDCVSLANRSVESVIKRSNVLPANSVTSFTLVSVCLPACLDTTRRMTIAAHRVIRPVPPVAVHTKTIVSLAPIRITNSMQRAFNIVLLATGEVVKMPQDTNNVYLVLPVASAVRSKKVVVLVWHVANAPTNGCLIHRPNSARIRRPTFVPKVKKNINFK